jgi:hypothetical protein
LPERAFIPAALFNELLVCGSLFRLCGWSIRQSQTLFLSLLILTLYLFYPYMKCYFCGMYDHSVFLFWL